ncbi:LacI family DNA-binding transcriptional regulator, partial [Micrococcus sp. SIMBA_144]
MVSSKDIAKKAGVSQSTVSRVINNPASVRKEKREAVERVMKELNYRPDSVARSLISNKTNQISLISG